MTEYPPFELLDNRSDPDTRGVLLDWLIDRGERETLLGVLLEYLDADADADADDADDADAANDDADADDAYADAANDAADADDADADAADADAYADDANADAYAYADDAADADDADADDANADADDADADAGFHALMGDLALEDGLKIIQIPGRYGSWAATFVCWLRRTRGDEWEMHPGFRAIYRVGTKRGIAWLAKSGPGDDYRCKEPSDVFEDVHRLRIKRCLRADELAWAALCPKPAGWPEP